MQIEIDAYTQIDSLLHRWDARYKLVGMLALMFAFAAVRSVYMVPWMLLITMVCYLMSRLPIIFLYHRIRYPGALLLIVVLLLPFAGGSTPLLVVGPLTLSMEGFMAALLIVGRFLSILTLGVILFGTSPFLTTIRALYALGVPALLNDMVLFFYRYINDIAAQLTTMQRAIRLRGFGSHRLNRHTLTTLVALSASLLLRSYEQSERVYYAMRLRGYGVGQSVASSHMFQATWRDGVVLGGMILLGVAVVAADIVLQGWV